MSVLSLTGTVGITALRRKTAFYSAATSTVKAPDLINRPRSENVKFCRLVITALCGNSDVMGKEREKWEKLKAFLGFLGEGGVVF